MVSAVPITKEMKEATRAAELCVALIGDRAGRVRSCTVCVLARVCPVRVAWGAPRSPRVYANGRRPQCLQSAST
jgi:hypothetical protein